jgi:hypothetical protein
MTAQPVHTRDGRPLGVLVVALVQFVRAILVAVQLVGRTLLPDDSLLRISFQVPRPPPGTLEFVLAQALGIGLIVASIAFGLGLLSGRRWGWIGAIVISGVSLAVAIGAWWADDPLYPAMLVNVIAVFYLNQRDVRAAFGELAADDRATDD